MLPILTGRLSSFVNSDSNTGGIFSEANRWTPTTPAIATTIVIPPKIKVEGRVNQRTAPEVFDGSRLSGGGLGGELVIGANAVSITEKLDPS
jgi:hypothetical protein